MGQEIDWSVPLALTFTECDTCRALPGSPMLCLGCRRNRAVIESLAAAASAAAKIRAAKTAAKILWPAR